eukprot:CAMPEP_0119332304 /NCGR_PEP_ID=MMETSP1333-20130426/82439_1 /TAXON_ID=418940 /ORGANISM="Scyphosphaera apsteinii, Strain RCC1455" /LENGTH=452 /DNA_ID=CAMNT_0007342101 /DNA_START=145 /DNA_END=1503 /DNA_ORIENTATION=-
MYGSHCRRYSCPCHGAVMLLPLLVPMLILQIWVTRSTEKGSAILASDSDSYFSDVDRQLRERNRARDPQACCQRKQAAARSHPRIRRQLHPSGQFILLQPKPRSYYNASALGKPLLRFALFSDTHFWMPSNARSAFLKKSDSEPVRDGLLVSDSEQVLPKLFTQLAAFAASGGDFAIHLGDIVCGGGTFRQPSEEYRRSLVSYAEQERAQLGRWPIFHLPGNHDLDPNMGGLSIWRDIFCSPLANGTGFRTCVTQTDEQAQGDPSVNYRSLHVGAWRLILLDATDGLKQDSDGHGHIGRTQLLWLEAELDDALKKRQQVILMMHQLLAMPASENAWLDLQQDFIDNRAEVIALLSRYEHVRLSLHGHVHANSLTTQHGIAFVSTAAAGEYPMQWREVIVYPCDLKMTTHELDMPALLEKSKQRDNRAGRNAIKMGPAMANSVILRTCDPSST